MARALNEFKIKNVQGLYSYTHFEADDGAFVQVHVRGDEYVYQSVSGERFTFNSVDALKRKLAE